MPRLALLATLALTAAVYWVGLSGPLILDDVSSLDPIAAWLHGKTGWMYVVFGNHSGLFGRPVAMASFALNAMLAGRDLDSWGLKFGNLLIHLANGVLVFIFFSALIRQGACTGNTDRKKSWLPWLGASLWLLHPLLVSTVLYVVQRMAMLSAFFTLLTLLAYLHGRIELAQGRRRRACTLLVFVVPLCTALAALSKENGILALALCALIELIVFQPTLGIRRSWQATLFIVVTLVLPALLAVILTLAQVNFITAGYAYWPFTLGQRLLTQPRVLWDYIGSLLLPSGPRLGLYHDDYLVSQTWLVPPTTLLAIAGWVVVITAAWRLRRRIPGLALGVGMFLVGQALESTVFPLLLYVEHRNYLPAVGAIWAFLSVAKFATDAISHRMHHPLRVFGAGAVAIVLSLAVTTSIRAHAWQSKQTLLEQALIYHPDSVWLRIELIHEAMKLQPPALTEARSQSDHLRSLPDRSARRLGTASRLYLDCASGDAANPDLVRDLFEGRPDPLNVNLLQFLETLSDGIGTQPCPGLSPAQMADGLAGLVDRSILPAGEVGIWRLRFRSANLYLAADRPDDAMKQAQLAYAGGTADPQVTVFIADLLLRKGDVVAASRMLEVAAQQIAPDDFDGQQVLSRYQAIIREGQK